MDPIPGPYSLPFLGNLLDIRSDEAPLKGFEHLADIYGPIYRLTLQGKKVIIVSSAEMMQQLTNESRFVKTAPPALAGDTGRPKGLFLAASEDPDWGQAHRILTPAFGPLPVEDMFEGMRDIANQLCMKWARMGADREVSLAEDFTRLTLDTIALCSMDYRFNSFYTDNQHPFVLAMMNLLSAAQAGGRPWIMNKLMPNKDAVFKEEDQALLQRISQEIIDHRRAHPVNKQDLLNSHETTSGLLSFVLALLLQNPDAYLKLRQEVDQVVGTSAIQPLHVKKLRYLAAVLREALRLCPTAPRMTKIINPSLKGEVVTLTDGDKRYHIEDGSLVSILLARSQSDPKVFGDDAKEFKPERMMDDNPDYEKFQAAWKPFGNGTRSCIGQTFAWQEAMMVVALVVQNFDIHLVDPAYQIRIKQTLTVKPANLMVKVALRNGLTSTDLDKRLHGSSVPETKPHLAAPTHAQRNKSGSLDGLTILFGSNSGTCQSLAQRLASTASSWNQINPEVRDLDSSIDLIRQGQPIIIITASYEGHPTDNAKRFVVWLQTLKGDELKGVKFAVFGCGHSDWLATLFKIPKMIDKLLTEHGATQMLPIGLSDVSKGSPLGDFESWMDDFWPTLWESSDREYSTSRLQAPAIDAEMKNDQRSTALASGMQTGIIKEVKSLTGPGEVEKRHMEIQLPSETNYECGDYLAVLPMNPESRVREIMAHYKLPWDATILLKSQAISNLPSNVPLSIYEILKGYFELSQPATKKNIETFKTFTTDSNTLNALDKLISNLETNQERYPPSIFNILETNPLINLPFPSFLSLLLPLRVRQYSISSSPLHDPTTCTITYGLLAPSTTNHQGVATTYLSHLQVGESMQISIRRTANPTFRLPLDPQTPLLMFCAGTGLAPFRAFIQHRTIIASTKSSQALGPALLFIGCRSPTDKLYASELEQAISLGAVDVRYAFSRAPESSGESKYVNDAMWRDREDVKRLWKSGARVYVCGSRAVAVGIRDTAKKIWEENVPRTLEGESEDETAFWKGVEERAASDVFD